MVAPIPRVATIYAVTPNPKVKQVKSDMWKKRPPVVKFRAFRDQLRLMDLTVQDGDFITFFLPMPRSWSKAERARMNGTPHRVRPDLDNLLGGLFDAARKTGEGEDDSDIAMLGGISKVWAEHGAIRVVPGQQHW